MFYDTSATCWATANVFHPAFLSFTHTHTRARTHTHAHTRTNACTAQARTHGKHTHTHTHIVNTHTHTVNTHTHTHMARVASQPRRKTEEKKVHALAKNNRRGEGHNTTHSTLTGLKHLITPGTANMELHLLSLSSVLMHLSCA